MKILISISTYLLPVFPYPPIPIFYPRCDAICATINSLTGCTLSWSSAMRYFGVYLVKNRSFKCSLENAKRAFYRVANSTLGKSAELPLKN